MKPRLLAIVPDPGGAFGQAGGVLSATRAVFGDELAATFDVRFVDTTMQAFPPPGLRERVAAGGRRAAAALRLIGSFRPDVALAFCGDATSFYEKSSLLLAAKAAGARAYLSPRSGRAKAWLDKSAAARRWVAFAGGRLDGFLVQSRAWRDVFASAGVPPHRLHVWHNAVDTTSWAPVAASRRPWSGDRPFRFLFMGWAIEPKGLRELVAAAERLAGAPGPPFELAVAGDGAVADELRARRARAELPAHVELLGWVTGDARVKEFSRADALVLPTYSEGFPNVVIEAMACALPVIATPVGATPDVVVDGETGLLIPPREVQPLMEAMDRLRSDPAGAAAMGRRGLSRALALFDRRLAVEELTRILSNGLKRPAPFD